MDERLRFVARLLDGEAMSEVCREFGISRKTGYKIFSRYREHGAEALSDRSRRPVRYANQLPVQIESLIVTLKREKPHWGARKIRELLVRRLAGDIRVPAKSTIHAVLHRHGLVKGLRRPRPRATGTPLSPGLAPNDLWCADFKGRVQARQRRVLLPAHRHRSRLALPAAVRSAGLDPREPCHHRLRATVPRARTACRHPLRQRRTLRQSQCLVQPLQTLRVVVAPGHRHRAHPPRPAPAERPSRTHAPDAQEGSHSTARQQQPAAAGQIRCLRQRIQLRATARSVGHEDSGRNLFRLNPTLPRLTRADLSSARSRCPGHRLRSHLHAPQEDQPLRPSWPVSAWASRRSTKASGSSASCTTISATSTWSRKPCNPSTTRSARGCYLCLRYGL